MTSPDTRCCPKCRDEETIAGYANITCDIPTCECHFVNAGKKCDYPGCENECYKGETLEWDGKEFCSEKHRRLYPGPAVVEKKEQEFFDRNSHFCSGCSQCQPPQPEKKCICEDMREAVGDGGKYVDDIEWNCPSHGAISYFSRGRVDKPQPAPWEERFDEEFPAMGISGDPKDKCIYRHDQYVNDESLLKSFIAKEIAAAEKRGRDAACDYIKANSGYHFVQTGGSIASNGQLHIKREVLEAARAAMKDETDKCYLEYVEGYLSCTYNHEIGARCLMDERVAQ